MNEGLLNKAKELLRIQEVYLRHTTAFIEFNADPEGINALIEAKNYETARGTNSLRVEELEINGEVVWEYHFYFFTGVRKTRDATEEEGRGEKSNKAKEEFENSIFNISATFDAVYHSSEELDDDVLQEFSKSNVAYHIWPFWREHLHSMCSKMDLVKIEVPHYMCSNKNN